MTDIPGEFDWVDARAKCSIKHQFAGLREVARADMDRRNGQLGGPRFHYADGMIDVGGAEQIAFRIWDGEANVRRAVEFKLSDGGITITLGETSVRVGLTLTDSGVCKFKVADQELAPWQLSRRVLEQLFFDRI